MWIDSENMNISISAAILITGGWGPWQSGVDGARKSAEMFLPWNNTTCQLPSLPDRRSSHVQAQQLLCGGGVSPARTSCISWNLQGGDWTTLPLTLTEDRYTSSGWYHDDQLVIMGGSWSETSEIVSSDGTVIPSSFTMKYKTG